MKIKHFLPSLDPQYGGPTASVPIQCIGLAKKGVNVTLATYSESQPYEQQLLINDVHIDHIDKPASKLLQLLYLSYLKYLSSNDDADIYHAHGVWLLVDHWISYFARRHNKKYILNPRGDLETYRINYSKWKKLKKRIAWKLYGEKDVQSASCIIATSLQEKDAIRRLGVKAPIAIIPNGLEISNFKIVHPRTRNTKRTMLFLSRVNPIKGLDVLLDAWSQLPVKLLSTWELHIVGNSDPLDYADKLKKRIQDLNLCESVKLLGPIVGEEKLRKYQEADVFVLPTRNENFGNVIAEAMLCECPAITTTNAPWNCLIEDKCGWWIELSTENLKTALIEGMSLTDEERRILGKKSRECIIQRYSCESVSSMTEKLYKWVLGNGDKPEFVYID